MKRITRILSVATACLLTAGSVYGLPENVSPEERGLAIARAADVRDQGWRDNASSMQMLLRNRSGQESNRELRRMAFEMNEEGAGDKSIIVFDAPRSIDGTALLSHTRILEADDQWIYLPALKRVKRISSGNKSGPFVGSEFAYEDLVSQEVDKYDYRWLRDETYSDLECTVVERIPRYENSGYARQVVWWDLKEYRIQRIDFYDRKNQLLKTMVSTGYQQYDGDYWRPERMVMENHQNGKSTDLVFFNWEFGTGVSESDFTASRLRRVR